MVVAIAFFFGGVQMSIIKCPRCDINFIREEEQYCSICKEK